MYLPNSVYERAPHYWLFIGALLVILGIYLGIEMDSRFLLLGVLLGLTSCGWGLRILVRRARRPGEVDVTSAPVSSD
jgi:hypothetical protein